MGTDTLSPSQRSERMSRVMGHGNKSTELRLLRLLKERRITGWRRAYRLYGRPDLVFPRQRLAVFIDGCFWHVCPEHYRRPKSRHEFWDAKARQNAARDAVVNAELSRRGWRVIRLWEHDLRPARSAAAIAQLTAVLETQFPRPAS